jgi:hypothetical protein
VDPIRKIVVFVLLGTKSCSGLQLAYSADLNRAGLVDSRLMMRQHLVATGLESVDQLPQQRRAGACVCVWVGVGVCCRCYTGSRSENLIRASVSSVNGASGGIVTICKAIVFAKPMSEGTESRR